MRNIPNVAATNRASFFSAPLKKESTALGLFHLHNGCESN